MQNVFSQLLADREAAKPAAEGVRPERSQLQLYFADQLLREEIERAAYNGSMPISVEEFAVSGELEITMNDKCRIWLNKDCSTIRISNGEVGFYYNKDKGSEKEKERFTSLHKHAFKLAERWYKTHGTFNIAKSVARA